MYPVEQYEQLTLFPPGTRDHAKVKVMSGSARARKMTDGSGLRLLGSWRKSHPLGLLARMLVGTSQWGSTRYLMTWGGLQYTAQPFHIPVIGVDGDHERYRVFIVAYSDKKSGLQTHQKISAIRKEWDTRKDVGGSDWRPIPRADWSVSRPPVSRTIDGIPNRLERCYGLGNAVSPYQVYPFMRYIKQVNDLLKGEIA